MVADYFTKPLQGSLFRRLRNMILDIAGHGIGLFKENYEQALIAFGLMESNASNRPVTLYMDKISPHIIYYPGSDESAMTSIISRH